MLRLWKKRILTVALLASCFWPSAALAQGLYQQYLDNWKHASDPLEIWVFANGRKLAEFMPQRNVGQIIFDISVEYANDNPQDDSRSLNANSARKLAKQRKEFRDRSFRPN
jgi:hypothetical protein